GRKKASEDGPRVEQVEQRRADCRDGLLARVVASAYGEQPVGDRGPLRERRGGAPQVEIPRVRKDAGRVHMTARGGLQIDAVYGRRIAQVRDGPEHQAVD